jgi:hypothetical protein
MSSAASTARRSFSTFSYCEAAATFSAVTSRAVPVAPITAPRASSSGTALKDRSTWLPFAPLVARLVVEHRFAGEDAAEHGDVALAHCPAKSSRAARGRSGRPAGSRRCAAWRPG